MLLSSLIGALLMCCDMQAVDTARMLAALASSTMTALCEICSGPYPPAHCVNSFNSNCKTQDQDCTYLTLGEVTCVMNE